MPDGVNISKSIRQISKHIQKGESILLKNKIVRRIALAISFLMLLTSTANTTYAYIVTKTDSIIYTFMPSESNSGSSTPDVPGSDDVVVNIKVDNNVKNTGTASITPEGFEFVLENTVSGEKITLITSEDGEAHLELPFTTEDAGKTFTYKLSAIDKGMNGVTYDEKVYVIHIAVSYDENNNLIAVVTVDGKTMTDAVASFENIYHSDTTDSPPTSDKNNVGFWLIMMLISGAAFIALTVWDRRYLNMN